MDDIGNIIYILFILVSILGGVWQNISKQKKEKQERKVAYEPVFQDDELEQLQTVKSEKDQEAAEKLKSMESAAQKASNERRLKRRNLLEEKEHLEREASLAAEMNAEDFDPKKAVIYSEILNPPYL
ncbi:MAG: hypothetical protein WEC59_04180 [Salibacteraceae bacterium]